MSIEDVKRKNEAWLLSLPGVVSVNIGIRPGGRVLQVYVKELSKELQQKVPAQIDGFFTELVRIDGVRKP